jgi:hypothetical protein
VLLSTEDYAARRGVTDRAVRKAINAGRLVASVTRQGRAWMVDAEMADREWAASTQERRGGGGTGPGQKRQPTAHRPLPPPAPPGGMPGNIPGQGQAAAIRTMYQARLLELELKQKQGQLVPKDDVDRVWFEEIRRARDAFRRLPLQMIGEVAQSVGGLTQEKRADVLLVIERHIVGVLEGLAKDAD